METGKGSHWLVGLGVFDFALAVGFRFTSHTALMLGALLALGAAFVVFALPFGTVGCAWDARLNEAARHKAAAWLGFGVESGPGRRFFSPIFTRPEQAAWVFRAIGLAVSLFCVYQLVHVLR